MAKPDFLIIGTQRGGTTSLNHVLSKHADIRMSSRKEIHFFDKFFRNGAAWYESFFPDDDVTPKTRRGEATPMYLFHPHVPARVRQLLPDVRLIVLLRDPVQRAYSHYMLERERNAESIASFREAVELEDERVSKETEKLLKDPEYFSTDFARYTYMRRGLYGEQLQRWFEYFQRDRFLILRSEDLFSDPDTELRKINDFLGIRQLVAKPYPMLNKKRHDELPEEFKKSLSAYFTEDGKLLRSLACERFTW